MVFQDGIRAAAVIAREHVEEVDREARFPKEAIDVLRDSGALSALADNVPFDQVTQACEDLARSCSATAMVFAMHQIQLACLVNHPTAWTVDYLDTLRREQRLIASVTSEVGTGGDTGRSVASLERSETGLTLTKQAPTVSYGEHADDYFTTVRRAPEAEPTDQVAVMHTGTQTTLLKTGNWEPLGMRGTCSPGFTVTAQFGQEQVLTDSYAQISRETMVPVSHLLWASLWIGIAAEAFERARRSVRSGNVPDGVRAHRLSLLYGDLSAARYHAAHVRNRWIEDVQQPGRPALQTMAAALRHNTLKTTVSECMSRVCFGSLELLGIAGYRNDSPLSVGRLLRDSLSAPLMVSNDRLHATDAALLMVVKDA